MPIFHSVHDRPAPPWIAVADREPPITERLLVVQNGQIRIGTLMPGLLGTPRVWAVEGSHHGAGITHWMPTPPLPESA